MLRPVSFTLLALLATAATATTAADKPNVVVIFVDDLGYADIGPFGATKQKTPNLDRMADEGMKLTSFYAAPVCSVSRAQLLTGCYGARISVPGVFFPAGPNGLHPQETTVAEHLQKLGYATRCVGKWHLGDQPPFLPTRQGFDHYFGIPYSNDMQRPSKETGQRVVPLVRDEQVVELLTDEDQRTVVEKYTADAVQFIHEHQQKPFFLYLPHTAVHTPILPSQRFLGKSNNGRFGDWVEEVDWSVGKVLDAIREAKLSEKTLVIFTSDNGPWLVKQADGGSAGPLRHGKGSTWEGGVRVPTIAWWPGSIAPGSRCDAVAGAIDLLPTCVSLAGGVVPAEPVIDGRDLSALLLGKSQESPREAHYYFQGYELQAVRQGPWKLAVAPQPATPPGKGTADDARQNPRLYNLTDDIGETVDVAGRHPEVVRKLQALAAAMNAQIGGASPTARRPAGKVDDPVTLYPTVTNRPAAAKPADLSRLALGAAVPSNAAPQIGGRAFTIRCRIDTQQPDAVVLAHGGVALGYALHLKGGRLVFSVRTARDVVTDVQSEPIGGAVQVTAALANDGAMTLTVGDQKPVVAKAPGPISRQPQEEFCVGHDAAAPVADYAGGKPFVGKITDLKVAVER